MLLTIGIALPKSNSVGGARARTSFQGGSMMFNTVDISGLRMFYREAGDSSKPTLLLLHGFPTSSYQFNDLIPRLADRFHVMAPDYPGMGFSDVPGPLIAKPTFDDVTKLVDAFVERYVPGPLVLYLHDIGGPIGMRIATSRPDRIAGLIFQNFTMSVDGWDADRLKLYEQLAGPETPAKLAQAEGFASVERSMFLHKTGAHDPEAVNPDNWAMDAYAFSLPKSRTFMAKLFLNVTTNIPHYPEWAGYLKERQPKALVVWGRNDPIIRPPAAAFVKSLLPAADVRYFDGGHFVLDEYVDPIADAIIETFSADV
jgi:pimeloyl-ACP methyl ester carboxylesterase